MRPSVLPAPSISAEGSASVRRFPATACDVRLAIAYGPLQLTPPFVETSDISDVSGPLSMGMMTLPLGWTTGCPPITLSDGSEPCVQVSPPSDE